MTPAKSSCGMRPRLRQRSRRSDGVARQPKRKQDQAPNSESQAIRGEQDGGLDRRRAIFMISVAAELAEMHPQTLRMYEARGLITPKRSPKNTRLYSYADVERLRRIQQMTADDGLNLAGVETVLSLERELEQARDGGRGGCANAPRSSSAR